MHAQKSMLMNLTRLSQVLWTDSDDLKSILNKRLIDFKNPSTETDSTLLDSCLMVKPCCAAHTTDPGAITRS